MLPYFCGPARHNGRALTSLPSPLMLHFFPRTARRAILPALSTLLSVLLPASTAVAQAPARPYRAFYGNLHAHSAYSDGNKDSLTTGANTPAQNFTFAKASQHLDFLGISEHNHASAGMRLPSWARGKQQADAATMDGQFVALYGMEFGTISNGGHVLIYGYPNLLGWEANNYDEFVPQGVFYWLWRKLRTQPDAVVTLAHPQTTDYDNILTSPYSASADSLVVGSAFRSGPAFSTNVNYLNQSTSSFEPYFQRLLARGYHAAPSYDHDNHNTTFGRTTEGRLVILADTLTRPALLAALKERRFYASDDWNVTVDFRLNGTAPMGTIATDLPSPTLSVTVADGDGEALPTLRLLRGVPGSGAQAQVWRTAPAGATALSVSDTTLALGQSAYYYVSLVQADGDRILSAPIWYTRGTPPVPTGVAPDLAATSAAVLVWPNPVANGVGAVTVAGATGPIDLYDGLGRLVRTACATATDDGGTLLDVRGLAPGFYIVRAAAAGGATVARTLVISE